MSVGAVARRIPPLLSILLLRRVPFWERSWPRRAGRVAALCAYGYAAVVVVMLSLEDRLLYLPGSAGQWFEPPPGLPVQEVELTSRDGNRICAWWSAPAGWKPADGAVLFSHGNGGNLSHRGWALRPWHDELRLAVLLYDYPGYGRSTGRASEAGCYAAADAAYDWLVEARKVPGERILLYGGSLGGAVATDLAARRPHRALVLVSAFTSFPDIAQQLYPWLPGRWLVHNRFDSLGKIASCRGPVFITHSKADGLIPFAQAERLFAAAGEPKQFVPTEAHSHNDSPAPDVFPALRCFLDEHAPLPPPTAN
jgi:pimeloyl-ACP methyl ester carboxylesterase